MIKTKNILVTLKDGRRYRINIIGKDEEFDLVMIQIKVKYLTQLSFGKPNQLKVGDFVVANWCPLRINPNSDF